MNARGAFERLHPAVQRRLWDMRWTELRPIQAKAIHHLLDQRGDCLISVPTAGGKTEAAFLPLLSLIADDFGGGIRAMYVGPLKALINDQFRRIEDLCSRMKVPVHRWHGDVGEGAKKHLLDNPSGVLLITPESLEAMLVLRPTKVPRLFARLQHVVVDETHAFMGTERGAQLQCQLERLSTRAGCDPIRVGLSATFGDPAQALRWLRPKGAPATMLDDPSAQREIQLRVRGFWRDRVGGGDREDTSQEELAEDEGEDPLAPIARAILLAVKGTSNLVFANAKSTIEALADSMVEEAARIGVRDEILVHHGSLSKSVREHAEARLSSGTPCTAVCSNTLEMGIDIGWMDSVVQVSAPPSVASLVQRLGRSGRTEGAPAKLRAFFLAFRPRADTSPWLLLHLDFLRGLAAIELMLEHFLEPIHVGRAHWSTLVQQTLSILAESGGLAAAKVFALAERSGAFADLDSASFAHVLRSLGTHGLIEQMPEGDLILAPRGQRLLEHYSFFAAFKAVDEVAVFHHTERIGSLPSDAIPALGDHVILAGKRWQVTQINMERRELAVERARGRRPPVFRSAGRDAHPTLHARMRTIALGTEVQPYLDETAAEILASARAEALQLGRFEPALQAGGRGALLFLWAGSKVSRTLHLNLRERGVDATNVDVGLDVAASPDEVKAALREVAAAPCSESSLAARAESELGAKLAGEKYDEFLPDEEWRASYARERLDLPGALGALARIAV